MQTHYKAGGILLDGKRNVFLIENKKWGVFQFPKGHINPKETPHDAALREVKEESGYQDIKILDSTPVKSTYTYFLEDGKPHKAEVEYFIMQLNSSKRIKTKQMREENLGGKWVPLLRAKNVVSFDNLREVLKEAKKMAYGRSSSRNSGAI